MKRKPGRPLTVRPDDGANHEVRHGDGYCPGSGTPENQSRSLARRQRGCGLERVRRLRKCDRGKQGEHEQPAHPNRGGWTGRIEHLGTPHVIRTHYIAIPPSTWRTWPVTYAAAGEHSQTTAPAMSSGVPALPSGICAAMPSIAFSETAAVMSVAM